MSGNRKQRRKHLRSETKGFDDFQKHAWFGLKKMIARSRWLESNPLGSVNNPLIVSPKEAELFEQEFGYVNLAKVKS